MRGTFFKGVILGAVVAAVTLVGTAAFAGSGIGGVFNLGQYNPVNATTELAGSTNNRQLYVVNTNTGTGATGIGVYTPGNRPPFVVSSATKVDHLNADLLDGVDSGSLQRRVGGHCNNGTAIKGIGTTGGVGCTASGVHAIHLSVAILGSASVDLAPAGITFDSNCNNSSTVGLGFTNNSGLTATVDNNFTLNSGTSSSSGSSFPPGSTGFSVAGTHLGGQWALSTSQFVVTLNIEESVTAGGCVYNGTATVVAL